jgi:hypothetical protein
LTIDKQDREKSKRVYLDNCVYNRPFDDQSQRRIFLETMAFITLLELVEKGKIETIKMGKKKLKQGLSEIRHKGWEILVEKQGISGATAFIIQYERGYGDYTEMRKEIFDKKGLDEILDEMESMGGDEEK